MGAGMAGGAGPPAAATRQARARRSTAGHHLGRGGRLLCRGWARRSAEVCTGRRPDVVAGTPSELLERCPASCPCGRGLGTSQVDQFLPSERSRQVWGGSLTNEGAVPRGATAAAGLLVACPCQWETTDGGEPASVIRRWRVTPVAVSQSCSCGAETGDMREHGRRVEAEAAGGGWDRGSGLEPEG